MNSNEFNLKDYIIEHNGIIEAKVIPNSSLNTIIFDNDILKIKIQEVPEDGKANKAVVKFLAKQLNIAKGDITIISGEKQHNKKLKITL